MVTVTLKTSPALQAIVRAAFPSYKRHHAFVSEFSPEYGKTINTFWDGGSRDVYVLIEIATLRIKPLPTHTHPFYDVQRHIQPGQNEWVSVDKHGMITLKQLPEGYALVQGGMFCGKPATAHVFLPPASPTLSLPAQTTAAIEDK